MAVAALGSDTGGSIRQPAGFCGVVGLKPTYGAVSRYGLIAMASSLDQIGPFAKTVEDASILFNAIKGRDLSDSTSVDLTAYEEKSLELEDIKNLTIGLPKEYFVAGLDNDVSKAINEAINNLKSLGIKFKEISLPHTRYALSVYYIIMPAEVSANLARFDGVQYGLRVKEDSLIEMYKATRKDGFGKEAKRRIILGTYALSHGYYEAYYLRALKVRTLIKNDFANAFGECDCILTPTNPSPAFKIGERLSDPLTMYLSDIYTISVNLAGIPAISIPCGFTKNKLPIGMQLLAKAFDEEMLFRVAYTYEQNTTWHKEKPKI